MKPPEGGFFLPQTGEIAPSPQVYNSLDIAQKKFRSPEESRLHMRARPQKSSASLPYTNDLKRGAATGVADHRESATALQRTAAMMTASPRTVAQLRLAAIAAGSTVVQYAMPKPLERFHPRSAADSVIGRFRTNHMTENLEYESAKARSVARGENNTFMAMTDADAYGEIKHLVGSSMNSETHTALPFENSLGDADGNVVTTHNSYDWIRVNHFSPYKKTSGHGKAQLGVCKERDGIKLKFCHFGSIGGAITQVNEEEKKAPPAPVVVAPTVRAGTARAEEQIAMPRTDTEHSDRPALALPGLTLDKYFRRKHDQRMLARERAAASTLD